MFGGGRGMGGGGGMLRVVGRTVTRAGVTNLQEPISSSSSTSAGSATSPTVNSRGIHKPNFSNNNNISLSSGNGSPFSMGNLPVCTNYGVSNTSPSSPFWAPFGGGGGSLCGEEYEWVSVDGSEDEGYIGMVDDFVLGPVPSPEEVHNAVSALTLVFDNASYSGIVKDKYACNSDEDISYPISGASGNLHPVSLLGSELDWMEPSPHFSNPKMLQSYGSNGVYDAFHLLQNDPSVKKMVISLSSDKAVWDAVLNNEAVRELRETYQADESITPQTSEETTDDSNPPRNIVRWIFENMRAKIMEIFETITKMVNELFKPSGNKAATAGTTDPFEEKLRTSFLISIVVLLVVVVTRAERA